ncbi:hypothetical protein HCN44_006927 [Aphidius gifuensis]|uniref:Uncharacterized protein n=1 Tax=Aphidius gifuensis TaxID=684658 RepID=A0A834XYD7_APHGI|nr:uncharacterized protein LOC122849707 [Aphidius gifuensis]KAF7995820.1 hypothetical protein HCN44_006927 [Aphidius gifuensis]
MQRVLSYQTARGFEETSEFITKRMCISFLFSIGFLCLVCGFCLGRFAADTASNTRVEQERLEHTGNGLENVEYMRQIIIEKLQNNNYSIDQLSYKNGSLKSIKEMLSSLEYFDKLTFQMGCIIGTVTGRREPDKFVVLHATESPTMSIVIEIIKELNNLNIQYKWIPRRSLTFIMCEKHHDNNDSSINNCIDYVPTYSRKNIVAFVSLEAESLYSDGKYLTSGSDMVTSVVLETMKEHKNIEHDIFNNKICRLNIDVPHARIKYTKLAIVSDDHDDMFIVNWKNFAGIATTSIWKLSQITLFHWYPQNIKDTIDHTLTDLHDVPSTLKKNIEDKIKIITKFGNNLKDKTNSITPFKPLDVRMMNDLILNLDINLLCLDENLKSKTDVTIIYESFTNKNNINKYLEEMLNCYNKIINNFTINIIT